MTARTDPLRLAAAVLLGIVTGAIIFLVIAIGIGSFNDLTHMNIKVTTNVAENVFSLILLIVLIVICIAAFWWKVVTTPPSEPASEEE